MNFNSILFSKEHIFSPFKMDYKNKEISIEDKKIKTIALSIIVGIFTAGIGGIIFFYCLSAKYKVEKLNTNADLPKNKNQKTPIKLTTNQNNLVTNTKKKNIKIKPIAKNFTTDNSIDMQRAAHLEAKQYLLTEAARIGAEVHFVSPDETLFSQDVNKIKINNDLDKTIFTWENTQGVQGDIQKDGKVPNQVVLYGVASQFNSCEAATRFTPKPGNAVETYKGDPTQGPGAQLQFPGAQVEMLNNAANLGFNGLCYVLDETTKDAVKHGYLTPGSKESADAVIEQLRINGNKMEFPCIGNIPKGENTEKVYEILVAAPAFGMYSLGDATDDQKKEIEFLCALHGYNAQFKQVIELAQSNSEIQVIFKPTAPGLGVFGNRVDSVAKAFYIAAKHYESVLLENKIQVRFQVFRGTGDAMNMANALGLNELK